MSIRWTLVFALLATSGCVVQQPAQPNDPAYAPVLGYADHMTPSTEGSLYNEATSMALFQDVKAARVGDVITVILNERTSSSKSATVGVDKESDIEIAPVGAGTLLGDTPSFRDFSLNSVLTAEREFEGESTADQSNSLTGNITVTIARVFPNGNLLVRGEKWLTLNRGDEFIRISGIARPQDIAPDNTISSQKLADARIAYSGTGELADAQQMGWLSRFFNSPIWPF